MPCLRPGLHSRTHRAWAKVLSLLQQGRGRLQSLPAGKPRRREGGTGGLETDSSPRKPVPALSGWGQGDSAHQRRVPTRPGRRPRPGLLEAASPLDGPSPRHLPPVGWPRHAGFAAGEVKPPRECVGKGGHGHMGTGGVGSGERGAGGHVGGPPDPALPGQTRSESQNTCRTPVPGQGCCAALPRDPERVLIPGCTGLSGASPARSALTRATAHYPAGLRGRLFQEAPADCPSSAPRQPGWLSVRSGFPGCMAGSAHPSICTLSRRLCVPVPKAALRNHTQSHCPPLPHAHPTQAGHVAHGAAQASDTPIRPGSGRNRSQGATPTKRRTRWARMRRAWAPPPVCPRGEDDSHRDEGTRDRSSEATSRPGPGAGKVSSPKSFHHENMKTFRRWNVSFNERKAT